MRCIQDKRIRFFFVLTVFFVLGVLLACLLWEANTSCLEKVLLPPSFSHPFGTDQLGRDMLIRTLHGVRYSFLLSFCITLISYLAGNVLGVFLGYHGGVANELFDYLVTFAMSVPLLILLIALASAVGGGQGVMIISVVVTETLYKARMARNETMVIKNADYVVALRILGAKDGHIILRHLLPHAFQLSLPLFSMLLGHTILSLSGFSFLGFGIQPPHADVGMIMRDSIRFIGAAPWLMVFPALFQVGMIISLSGLGDALSAFYDRRSRKL